MSESTGSSHAVYEIRVGGQLSSDWSDWLGGMTITPIGADETRIAGPVADQSALYGVLAQLHTLNLTLIEVRRVSAAMPQEHGSQ